MTSLDVSGDAWKREYFYRINTLSSQRYMTSLETFYGGQQTLRYGAQRHYGGQRTLSMAPSVTMAASGP